MKEHPIIFSTVMVRAILEGRKTQTRRVVKERWVSLVEEVLKINGKYDLTIPYGQIGDRLWVRETWRIEKENPIRDLNTLAIIDYDNPTIMYKADKLPHIQEILKPYWKPSIFMPRWTSRITLEITDIRVEKLQDINRHDINQEGTPQNIAGKLSYRNDGYQRLEDFRLLWDSINGKKYPWSSNPWVWVIEFKKL